MRFFSYYILFILLSFQAWGQSVIITEIMADPTPSYGLPEKEYIEIYNPTEKAISLHKFKLQYGSSSAEFPNVSLAPKSYAIVLRKGNGIAMQSYGNVIELANFSLVNTGATLKLFNALNQLIFVVTYSDKWYDATRNQGYSLEMIDTDFACVEEGNWTSSLATLGGTPAQQNSAARANPDTTMPQLLRFEVLNSKLLKLVFSEKLDSVSVFRAKYSFDNGLKIKQINNDSPSYKNVLLSLVSALEDDELYQFTVQDVADCSGNLLREAQMTVANLQPADSGDVVINEILFNPRVGGEDFVELYNRTDKMLSLKDWSLANLDDAGNLDNMKPITPNYFVLLPHQYLVLTKNTEKVCSQYMRAVKKNFLEMPSLPSFPDDKGAVVLINNTNQIFDKLVYTEKMHHPLIDDPSGVSLEKIDVNISSSIISNWQSAAKEHDYATPGYQNSQAILEKPKESFYFEPAILTPDGDGVDEFTSLKYQLTYSGSVATIRLFDMNGRMVRQLAQNQLLATTGEIVFDGKSQSGNMLPVGYYVALIELYNPNGETQTLKEKVVVGSKY